MQVFDCRLNLIVKIDCWTCQVALEKSLIAGKVERRENIDQEESELVIRIVNTISDWIKVTGLLQLVEKFFYYHDCLWKLNILMSFTCKLLQKKNTFLSQSASIEDIDRVFTKMNRLYS